MKLQPHNTLDLVAEQRERRRTSLACFIGTVIELYDYFLYGTYAALIFPKLFFPNVEPALAVIASFATYGVGFLLRPLGSVLFGNLGDRHGRRIALLVSLSVMTVSTFCIGLLPTYEVAGIGATFMLCGLRMLQGLAVGGEWGAAAVTAVEHALSGKRGLFGSVVQMGAPVGFLLSMLTFSLVSGSMHESSFNDWGWRIPFLLNIVFLFVGWILRSKLRESPVFLAMAGRNERSKVPLTALLRTHWKPLLIAIGIKVQQNGTFHFYGAFMLSYLASTLALPRSVGLNALATTAIFALPALAFWAHLSDRFGRRRICTFGCVASALMVLPFLWVTESRSALLITLGMVACMNVAHDAQYAPLPSFMSEMFETNVRLSGVAISSQIGAALSGAFVPMIAATLLYTGGSIWTVGLYMVGLGVVGTTATLLAPETYRSNLGKEAVEA